MLVRELIGAMMLVLTGCLVGMVLSSLIMTWPGNTRHNPSSKEQGDAASRDTKQPQGTLES